MPRLRARLSREEGFTLIELLIVMVYLSILIAIAVPSYVRFRVRAQDAKAEANIRTAITSAEAYYTDNGNYTSMTKTALIASYNSGLSSDSNLKLAVISSSQYCWSDPGGGVTWYYLGPGGSLTTSKPNASCP
jgi:prepilin-type N-terminal cleavage/methylation domain-containing protein